MRNISKAQKQRFVKNWKAFHAHNKQVKQPVVVCKDPYHTRRMGPLRPEFYVLYNYLRNRPLDVGIAPTIIDAFNTSNIRNKMWNAAMKINSFVGMEGTSYHDQFFVPAMAKYKEVFGEELTSDVLREFKLYIQKRY